MFLDIDMIQHYIWGGRTHTHMHACTHARTHACTHARTHSRTHACMHAHRNGMGRRKEGGGRRRVGRGGKRGRGKCVTMYLRSCEEVWLSQDYIHEKYHQGTWPECSPNAQYPMTQCQLRKHTQAQSHSNLILQQAAS